MSPGTTRRGFLALLGGALAAGSARAQLPPKVAAARTQGLEDAMRRVTGGAEVRKGKVTLDVPPLIDNGNSVPITVKVESPMTPAEHVKAIHVFTEKNPQPYILAARLGPRAGRASLTTRARIADTGRVIALAQLSDGSFWADSVDVLVTVSACLEDGFI
jgi:sulfur-oxidizing protein SoxY